MIARACTIPGLLDPDERGGMENGTGAGGTGMGLGATGSAGGVMGSSGSAEGSDFSSVIFIFSLQAIWINLFYPI